MKFPKLLKFFTLILISFFAYKTYAFFSKEDVVLDYSRVDKKIEINDNGLTFEVVSKSDTIEKIIQENNISLEKYDKIIPELSSPAFPRMEIEIKRAVPISIEADGKTIKNYTLAKSISDVLTENGIILSRLDKVSPNQTELPRKDTEITVTRINVEEVTVQEEIDYKTVAKKDSKLGWREKKIETPGENGILEVLYKITYQNGKEISRVALSKEIKKEPVNQIETQGTYMKLKKADKGQATWYAYQGGMFAASTTIPKGGYAKVTNTANGKSIIVQINDYGPQGKERVIDLDKMAFQSIATLDAGVIGVKVEEVLN